MENPFTIQPLNLGVARGGAAQAISLEPDPNYSPFGQ